LSFRKSKHVFGSRQQTVKYCNKSPTTSLEPKEELESLLKQGALSKVWRQALIGVACCSAKGSCIIKLFVSTVLESTFKKIATPSHIETTLNNTTGKTTLCCSA